MLASRHLYTKEPLIYVYEVALDRLLVPSLDPERRLVFSSILAEVVKDQLRLPRPSKTPDCEQSRPLVRAWLDVELFSYPIA